ncbi:hypothetical protein [Rheinheimera sp. F8]|uniref:hypothetical protein n=1 Tax=Rheinheimera sp. F8 TaxID=1763998 RepID=UPI000744BD63|nr:hypothetical protein [Rheinheimera sp. F8]ALZ75063.1 hypothetical protein ATY27_04365 [Rheinheimera sp. F8]ALZ76511.1 hypothetical protein ATY27_12575 [Rheinheimera sp. F8]
MQSLNTVSSSVLVFAAASLMAPMVQAITLYPHESCHKVQRYVARQMEDCQYVIEKPLIISGGQCHAEGVTTLSDYPTLMHRDFMALASLQTSYIENNYKEMISQSIYDIQASEGFDRVSSINAYVQGEVQMKVLGVVAADGTVPVLLNGFGLQGIGELKKWPATVRIFLTLNDVEIRGHYNVMTGQLQAIPDLSTAQPQISQQVDVPFVFKLLNKLTPNIIRKLQAELGRFSVRLSNALGIDEELPARIIYNANIQPGVLTPLQGLQGKQPGDMINLQISFNHHLLEYKDPNAYFAAAQFPGCVIESAWE